VTSRRCRGARRCSVAAEQRTLRDELGFEPGTELDIEAVDGRLEVSVPSRVRIVQGPPGPYLTADDPDAKLSDEDVRSVLEGVRVLPSHALLESYSTLTRLPLGLALAAETPPHCLISGFPGSRLF
jgi:hypothetical protein